MESLFIKLVNMSITAGLLVLVVAAVRLVFRKVPRWIYCILWGLVAVRLIVPVSFESRLSLVPSTEVIPADISDTAHPQIHSGITKIDEDLNKQLPPSLYTGSQDETYRSGETPDNAESKAVSSDSPSGMDYGSLEGRTLDSVDPTQVLSFILSRLWLIGAAGLLLYALISYILLRRRVMTAVRLEDNVYQSEFVISPFLLGLVRPKIYLPYGFDANERKYVIAHEKAHIARLDHLWKPFGFVLLAVYWFNPLIWAAYIFLCRDIESACDEKVIVGMQPEERRAYSNVLLNTSIGVNRRYVAACPLAFGEVGVKDRIKSVMNYKKPVFWIVAAAIVGCIVLAVCFLTDPVKDKANGADSQTVAGNETGNGTGMQLGTGKEAGMDTEAGNTADPQNANGTEAGLQPDGNGNAGVAEPMPTSLEYINAVETEGLPRSESIFADGMYDAIREDWDRWEAMDQFSRMASSHLAGAGHKYFETWKEAVEFIGVEPWNPLEDADWLEIMNYTGADVRNLFDENMLPHCSLEWYGTQDDKLIFAEVTTGYATSGGIRVTIRIDLYNTATQGYDQILDGESSAVALTDTYHERATAKQANFQHKNADGLVFDYTLRVVSLETGQGAIKKPTEVMNRVLKYMGMDEISTTKEERESGETDNSIDTAGNDMIPGTDSDTDNDINNGGDDHIPGTDTESDTDYYINTGENASTDSIEIEYTDKPDISDGLQIVVWQMAAGSYRCIMLPKNEEINAVYLLGGLYQKNILASGTPDMILQEIDKLENSRETAPSGQKYDISDGNIVVRVVTNPISSYADPLFGTDAYLKEVSAQFDERFKVERGEVVYFLD
ncbi:MAG: M56 family metallopeptidase [Lachnospiraceae bacterium]|nr:M56 family metallopeptidase [Lachnospiraceae bacterium]